MFTKHSPHLTRDVNHGNHNSQSRQTHTEREEKAEKLWASGEQQVSAAKPQSGFIFQNQKNMDLEPTSLRKHPAMSSGEELGIKYSVEGRLQKAKKNWG